MVVAFFGHKDTPSTVKPLLEQTVQQLIEENEEITFLVGTHGAFDCMAQSVLKKASELYPRISCNIVLANLRVDNREQYELPTLVPEGIEFALEKYAIFFRNDYMMRECDTVVCYITHGWSRAMQSVQKAKRNGKTIINLANL